MTEPKEAQEGDPGAFHVARGKRIDVLPPRRVRVGPHDYDVRLGKEGEIPLGWFGFHCSAELLILLHKEQHASQIVDSTIHEILHAIWDVIDLPQDIEETAVSRLAPALLKLWQDNPKLIAWIDAQVKAKPRFV